MNLKEMSKSYFILQKKQTNKKKTHKKQQYTFELKKMKHHEGYCIIFIIKYNFCNEKKNLAIFIM